MGDRALGVTEITTELDFYDYEAKYAARRLPPYSAGARFPLPVAEQAMELAVKAHQVLGCRGVTRTDFRYDDTGAKPRLIVLETNTQPGMTPTSLVPEQAAHVGMLLRQIVPLDRGGRVMRSVKVERKPRENPRVRATRQASAAGARSRVCRVAAARTRAQGIIARAKAAIGRFSAPPVCSG